MIDRNNKRAVREFMKTVKLTYETGKVTEHTYRPALTLLCDTLGAGEVRAINEAKRIRCGAPDITLMHEDIAIGYIEAKDIGVSIRSHRGANKNQFDRYINDLDNLIYTDCLKWDFYLNGDLKRSVSIAEIRGGELKPKPDNFDELADYLLEFLDQRPKTIKTAEELTEYMAKRTHMIRYSFGRGMTDTRPFEALVKQHKLFDKVLVKGISPDEFIDIYAQTITYGILIAKLRNKADTKFIRQNIPSLLPTTYPFLKKLFLFIASDDLNNALDWAIDDLITLYRAADVTGIMATYGQGSGREDPFLHFYEDFLYAYNPEERKNSGVYYTPKPVVDFIVREVDWVLKNKFDLPEGLANSEKTNVPWKTDKVGDLDRRDVHKVQILDPATGTGTFLAQTIRHIAKQVKTSAPGNWDAYVDNDLLPRLHGFEYMMAPYAMSYLKLDMVLADLDYTSLEENPKRMSIYLTNSLTDTAKDIPDLSFNDWLAEEVEGAANIKDNYPIMCIMGNPPYSGESTNKDPWIMRLMEDYKKSPQLKKPAQAKWINDDYVKFIRMAQHMVDKNGEGVVGMITNHGYLDNPTFCDMRSQLMKSFDGIYVLDLHGNSRKKEVAPNGDPDKNVFDIMAGVSIIIAWKKKQAEGTEKPLAQFFRGDLWGEREEKFKALQTESLDSGLFEQIEPRKPDYFFKSVDYDLLEEYRKGFKITEFMLNNAPGIVTTHDQFAISWDAPDARQKIEDFLTTETEAEARQLWRLCSQNQWNYDKAKTELSKNKWHDKVVEISYRPFDTRTTVYNSHVAVHRRDKRIMRHFLEGDNLGLLVKRQCKQDFSYAFITDKIAESCVFESAYANNSVLPLYLYPDETSLDKTIRINMEPTIRKVIEGVAIDSEHGKPDEYAIFDYIYGLLHALKYRERYAEFLKEDFPYIPYPKDSAEFWHLSSVGTKLRKLHLMEGWDSPAVYTFTGKGDGIVQRAKFNDGKVWINDTQYFDSVPESAWDFYIGGRKPAQKWLSERRRRALNQNDITHYQKIIAVLVQTEQTMQTIKWSKP